jgi:hypothetical protein
VGDNEPPHARSGAGNRGARVEARRSRAHPPPVREGDHLAAAVYRRSIGRASAHLHGATGGRRGRGTMAPAPSLRRGQRGEAFEPGPIARGDLGAHLRDLTGPDAGVTSAALLARCLRNVCGMLAGARSRGAPFRGTRRVPGGHSALGPPTAAPLDRSPERLRVHHHANRAAEAQQGTSRERLALYCPGCAHGLLWPSRA